MTPTMLSQLENEAKAEAMQGLLRGLHAVGKIQETPTAPCDYSILHVGVPKSSDSRPIHERDSPLDDYVDPRVCS